LQNYISIVALRAKVDKAARLVASLLWTRLDACDVGAAAPVSRDGGAKTSRAQRVTQTHAAGVYGGAIWI